MLIKEIFKENLRNWFKEKWVDISKKIGGEHPPCGYSSDKGKRKNNPQHAYPKCLPKEKASKLSKDKKEKLVRKKRRVELKTKTKKGRSPNFVKNS